MNYVTFILRNLENVPGKSGVGQGEVREKSGNFFLSKSVGTLMYVCVYLHVCMCVCVQICMCVYECMCVYV